MANYEYCPICDTMTVWLEDLSGSWCNACGCDLIEDPVPGHKAANDIVDPQTGEMIVAAGQVVTKLLQRRLRTVAVAVWLDEPNLGSNAWPWIEEVHRVLVQAALADWRNR